MNKHWSKEERILILELYWQLSPKEIIKQKARHPMIISLANKIGATDKVNSIYLRLCNFIYLDSNEKRGYLESGLEIKNFGQNFTTNGMNSP